MKWWVCCLSLFISILTNANELSLDDLQLKVLQGIAKFEQTSLEDWSYRVSRYENEEGTVTQSVELHVPHLDADNPWQLVSQDGEPASNSQKQQFRADKAEQNKNSTNSFTLSLRNLIQLPSLELLSENQNTFHAGFSVYVEKLGKKASKMLKGVLIYDKELDFIKSINITNTDTFSPLFSARITHFRLSMHFIQIDESVLPAQNNLSMKGSFAFFSEIDEVSQDTFSEYERVNEKSSRIKNLVTD